MVVDIGDVYAWRTDEGAVALLGNVDSGEGGATGAPTSCWRYGWVNQMDFSPSVCPGLQDRLAENSAQG